MMRLFFALEPGEALAVRIADWRDRQFPGLGRPVPAANLHITLAFLGEIKPQRLDSLCRGTDETLAPGRFPGGRLRLDEFGYWPRPGIYWLGPAHWPNALDRLAEGLQHRGQAAGGKRSRKRYRPHLTLFRGCADPPPAPVARPAFDFDYHSVSLMETRQGRRGVSYQALAHWALGP